MGDGTLIHQTAIVGKDVDLGNDVSIGPYAVVEGKVRIGDCCRIMSHATLLGPLTMGSDNVVHPGAVVGDISQDLKYRGEETQVIIGNGNSIRECTTIQQGTAGGGGRTIVGDNNLVMAYAHIAHDCTIGNSVIIVNAVQIAGHVIIHDHARIEGIVGIHQFVTIGSHAFVGFLSRITRDVPPFMIVEGNPSRVRGVNVVGLQRAGFSDVQIKALRDAHRILYRAGRDFSAKLSMLRDAQYADDKNLQYLASFVEAASRGKNGRALETARP